MNADALIQTIVNQHQSAYGGDGTYSQTIERMAAISLGKISVESVTGIVEPFLYGWGRMGRVLGRQEFLGWQSKVAEIIRGNSTILGEFQNSSLATANVGTHRQAITSLFQALREATGPIAAAKILNITCPEFFPLWDNRIANAVRRELANLQGDGFNRSIEPFSGLDYLRFMGAIQLFISKHQRIILLLSHQYGQKNLRIIDECFWQMTGRPLSLLF